MGKTMLASELVKELQKLIDEYGDRQMVFLHEGGCGRDWEDNCIVDAISSWGGHDYISLEV